MCKICIIHNRFGKFESRIDLSSYASVPAERCGTLIRLVSEANSLFPWRCSMIWVRQDAEPMHSLAPKIPSRGDAWSGYIPSSRTEAASERRNGTAKHRPSSARESGRAPMPGAQRRASGKFSATPRSGETPGWTAWSVRPTGPKCRSTRPDSASRLGRKRHAARLVASDASRSVENRQTLVGLLPNPHVDPRVVMPMPILRNLQRQPIVAHGVVVPDHAVDLNDWMLAQIPMERHESRALPFGRTRKPCIALRQIRLPKKAVRRIHRRDLVLAKLLRQTVPSVPNMRSERPRARGEYAAIISMPRSRIARPTCVGLPLSTLPPASGAYRQREPRST